MSHAPTRWSIKGAVFAASLAVVFAACSGSTASPSASTAAAPSTAPSTGAASARLPPAAAAFTAMSYPATGDAPCGVAPYTGNMKKITAIDALTVEFQLCSPDASFLPKVAFSAFGIQDSDYLTAHVPDGSILDGSERHRARTTSRNGARATGSSGPPTPTTGATRPRPRPSSSAGATSRPPACVDLQSGTVDGIDNPGTPDIATIQGDSTLKFYPRAGLNTLFLGFNNTQKPFDDVRVRQAIAMGIDRDQIVKNFYPDGSTVADYFTPCEIPIRLHRRQDLDLRPGRRPRRSSTDAGFPDGSGPQRRHQLPRGGPRLQPEPAGHRHRDRPAAQEEPRHHRDPEAARVGRHARRLHRRAPSRVSA